MRVRAVLRAITYITQYHPVGDAPCGRPENERSGLLHCCVAALARAAYVTRWP
ncbi:hypothetical protein SAMN05414139_07156 [Burkholderia sp. D7]|jgi:hypothetical protein|nr:hypothetical protein SAMN05414139_07156 [Burkholderia sp. D7]